VPNSPNNVEPRSLRRATPNDVEIGMNRRTWLGAVVAVTLLTAGCAATASGAPQDADPHATHVMPDGTVMDGSEHGATGAEHDAMGTEHDAMGDAAGPSEAAQMVCAGQVVTAVSSIFETDEPIAPSSTWTEPMFTCTYEIDGDPLVLTVYDAADERDGEQHFAELEGSTDGAERIEGLLGLGLPSFSTGDGIVGFLRDGKTLLVDATGLPERLGADGTKTRHDMAYAVASAVLVCWVHHS
jgi:hypothetical protein